MLDKLKRGHSLSLYLVIIRMVIFCSNLAMIIYDQKAHKTQRTKTPNDKERHRTFPIKEKNASELEWLVAI
jgi:hypothetical protein